MAEQHHILVVEDDPVARTAVLSYFQSAGYRVSEAEDGETMWKALDRSPIDLIMLDISLPGEDGFALLRELRRNSEVAVIIVTARKESIDCVLGLELGANDYVTKPFNPRELLARAKNVIRLTRAAREAGVGERSLRFGDWTLDRRSRRLTASSGEDKALTRAEFDLLDLLANNAGRAMTRDILLDHVSHRDAAPFDRTIDVLVGRLRRKIEDDPKDPRRLITIHGVGYMFVAD